MTATAAPGWDTCAELDCSGVRLAVGDRCLAHAAEQDVVVELKRIFDERTLDARGVPINGQLLERLLTACPRGDDDRPVLKGARLDRATFEDEAVFDNATFEDEAVFSGATFKDKASFSFATFKGRARFDGVTFERWTGFGRAIFEGWAGFDGVTFEGTARFKRATFKHYAVFSGATFEGEAVFSFTTFEDEAWFGGATFEQARQLGPMLVRKQLRLDQAVFKQRIQIEVGAAAVCCQRVRFPSGVQLRLRWASVVLDDADLAGPSILAGIPPFPELDEGRFARAWARLPPPHDDGARPRLLSVRSADLVGLTMSNVDLRACRFLGAHNLDKLRIEGQPLLARARGRRRTGRLTLAEEHYWRDQAPRHRRGWYPSACQLPAWAGLEPANRPSPAQIAGLYRELRRGREDSKDEPGAADFYYGEMEMRRHAAPWWSVERVLLTLYWLVSGYALRAWRALAALLLMIVVAAGLFATVGFKSPDSPRFVPVRVSSTGALVYQQQPVQRPSAWRQMPAALGYSAEVATSLLRGPERPVTAAGAWTQAVLRWLGPLLFGLALLSLRGRVKR